MSAKQISDGFHLKFSIGRALWNDLFAAGLPYRVGNGSFDLIRNLHAGYKQLEVREKVRGLLADTQVPEVLVKGADWAIKDIVGAREVLSWGGKVKLET